MLDFSAFVTFAVCYHRPSLLSAFVTFVSIAYNAYAESRLDDLSPPAPSGRGTG